MEPEEELKKRLLNEANNPVVWDQCLFYYERLMDPIQGCALLLELHPESLKLRKHLGDFLFSRNLFEKALEQFSWSRFLDPRGKSGMKGLREIAQLFSIYRGFFSQDSNERYLACNTVEKKPEFLPLFLYLSFRDREITVRQKASQVLKKHYPSEKIIPWILNAFPRFKQVDFENWHSFLMSQEKEEILIETLLAMVTFGNSELLNIVSDYLEEISFAPKTKNLILSYFPKPKSTRHQNN